MDFINEKEITKITIEVGENKFQWETPHNDTDMEDILEALYGMLIGLTFHPETVLKSMKDFAEERLPEEKEENE